ncbi:uncharacterized protein SRS1_14971 [Sporisorium reilianum f. sp. reilianum]|uniref:Uncharacterized protein n=1 Tax=Sporisorium reilianum f. sp. reilianum TaxID=72559 RepID=A0A2N8UIQ1_9BASI|nr:uncharacterized protein SRS1_14971 [Sporisorium reilianum f. sp. reilianum]
MHTTAATTTTPDLVGVLVVLVAPSTPADQQRFEELQTLRRRHDRAFDRWLPHITLVPPFTLPSSSSDARSRGDLDGLVQLHADQLAQIARAAAEVCSRHSSHQLRLDHVSTFPLRKYTNVHLRPAPTNFHDKRTPASSAPSNTSSHRIVELQADLADAITPLVSSSGVRRRETFKPHVSVGQATTPKATWQLCTSAGSAAAGLLCDVHRVQLMLKPKGFAGMYRVHEELALAASSMADQ